MDGERRGKLSSFLIGGLLGSAAGLAAAGRMKVKTTRPRQTTPRGLAAFEEAPCYRESAQRGSSENGSADE